MKQHYPFPFAAINTRMSLKMFSHLLIAYVNIKLCCACAYFEQKIYFIF